MEELGPAPEPSFRVFERPHSGSKSFDGSAALKSYIGESGGNNNNNSSEDPYPDNIFAGIERRPMTDNTNTNANTTNNHDDNNSNIGQGKPPARPRMGRLTGSNGSGGTNTSGSSGKLYYDSSSSAKFSSSSTLPSSTDTSAHDVPIPPIPESPFSFSLRASARTFSFGSKAPKAPPHGPPSTPARQTAQPATRERALTASTTSTATPPKLLESDFNIEGSGDLGNIFESYDDAKHHTEAPPSPTLQVCFDYLSSFYYYIVSRCLTMLRNLLRLLDPPTLRKKIDQKAKLPRLSPPSSAAPNPPFLQTTAKRRAIA